MKTLYTLLLLSVISSQTWAQRTTLRYELKNKAQFCGDILEIDQVRQMVYWQQTCGCIAGQIMMNIGISKYMLNGNVYTFAGVPISQFLMATIKDYKDGNEKEPSIVFLDMNKDTVQIDSLVIFRYDKEKITNYRGLKSKRKGNSYVFDLDKLSNRTHFTIPLLHSLFQEDVIFEIPLEGKNTLVVQFNFPKYFCATKGIGQILYNGLSGQYTISSDSLLVNKKTKEIFRKIQ